jgi:uncharacterized membrane protein YcaP (DUF421 family)
MHGAFELSMPWWHFVWRGIGVYLAVLIGLRLAGKRSFGDMSTFDVVVLMVVGGSLRTAIIGKDASFIGPLIAVASMLVVNRIIGWISARQPWFEKWIEGTPGVLARDGRRDPAALRSYDIADAELDRQLRSAGLEDEHDVAIARLEATGKITLIRRHSPRGEPLR